MKKVFLSLCMLMLAVGSVSAQSTMSDEQIIKFVMKEQKSGSSQQEIVTKLMQKGVTIDQIRQVRKKVERMQKNQGLGAVKDKELMTEDEEIDARLRKNNGKEKNSATEKLKDDKLVKNRDLKNRKLNKYGKNKRLVKEDEYDMKAELDDVLPDSLDIYDKQVIKKYLKDKEREEGKEGNKIFGHDIFNNEDLTFERRGAAATAKLFVIGDGAVPMFAARELKLR